MGIFDLFSSGNEKSAMRKQQAGINAGRTLAMGDLDQGQADYDRYAGQAYDEFGTYDQLGRGSSNMYGDALGLGGAEGNARATSAFQAGPGYEFQRDEALRALERTGAARGQTDTGNLYTALTDRAGNMANQEYGGWLDRLSQNTDRGINVAGSRAGILSNQGQTAYGTGGAKAGLNWAAETGIGQAGAEYEKSKDQTGANIFDAVMGGLKLFAGF